jgi:hypothetical protein
MTDVLTPVLEREVRFSGSYMSSRRTGNAVYTVIEYPEVLFPRLKYRPENLERCGGHSELEIRWAFHHLITENQGIINRSDLNERLPSARDRRHLPDGTVAEDSDPFADCRNFYAPAILNGHGFLTMASLDILDLDTPVHLNSIVGQQGVVYASGEALYVASSYLYDDRESWFFPDPGDIGEAITIHEFSLCHSPAESYYEASGVVEGRPLNQFSMGEHEGHQGSFAWFEGIELQIFDISDMGNPLQMHKEII